MNPLSVNGCHMLVRSEQIKTTALWWEVTVSSTTNFAQTPLNKYFGFKKLVGRQRPLHSKYLKVEWLRIPIAKLMH